MIGPRSRWTERLVRGATLVFFCLVSAPAQGLLQTWQQQHFLESSENLARLVVSRSGRVLAAMDGSRIRVVDLDRKQTQQVVTPEAPPGPLALSSGGELLAYASGTAVYVVDLLAKALPRKVGTAPAPVGKLAVSPARDQVALACSDGLRVLNLETGESLFSETSSPCLGVQFDPDGHCLALAQGRRIAILELPNWNLRWERRVTFFPSALDFSLSGQLLAVGGDTNLALVLDATDGQERHRVAFGFSVSRVTHVALTPDGSGLVGAADRRLLVKEALASPEDPRPIKLDERINGLAFSPRAQMLLASTEGTRYLNAWTARLPLPPDLSPAGSMPSVARIVPPRIRILASPAGRAFAGREARVVLRGSAEDSQPIQGWSIRVDGREVKAPGGPIPPTGAPGRLPGEVDYAFTVPLPEGDCILSFQARTPYAASTLESVTIQRGALPRVATVLPRLRVLAVGISAYQDTQLSRRFAARDAAELAASFKAMEGRTFLDVETRLLQDGGATRAAIDEGMDWLRTAGPQDVVLVYLSAQGWAPEAGQAFYVVPHDGRPKSSLRTLISGARLQAALEELPATRIVLLDLPAAAGASGVERFQEDLDRAGKGMIVLAGPEAARDDPALGHGVLAAALLEGLGGKARRDERGAVTWKAWLEYAVRRMGELQAAPVAGIPPGSMAARDFPVALPDTEAGHSRP